jgi:hypothetical protein
MKTRSSAVDRGRARTNQCMGLKTNGKCLVAALSLAWFLAGCDTPPTSPTQQPSLTSGGENAFDQRVRRRSVDQADAKDRAPR